MHIFMTFGFPHFRHVSGSGDTCDGPVGTTTAKFSLRPHFHIFYDDGIEFTGLRQPRNPGSATGKTGTGPAATKSARVDEADHCWLPLAPAHAAPMRPPQPARSAPFHVRQNPQRPAPRYGKRERSTKKTAARRRPSVQPGTATKR